MGSLAISSTWVAFFQYAAIALAFRLILFGNPVVHVDEEFYQLVAWRWTQGDLPFVDIWDRKPVGLFLLYRLFLLVPGDPIRIYQLFGIASTAATALVIQRLAREIARPSSAWLAGIVYVFAMPAFSCSFGQAPVFYNLLMALAAFALVDVWKRAEAPDLLVRGIIIMLLVGVAMQIKYSVLFEGIAFGCMLLARGWADVWSWRRLALAGLIWALTALFPTILAFACYAAIGHADDFLQANFISILHRLPDGEASWIRLATQLGALTPFWLAILVAPRFMAMPRARHPLVPAVLRAWAIAAIAGYLVFGTWYDHYVAPMLAPLSVLAAPVLARSVPDERWFGRLLLVASAIGGLAVMGIQFKNHGTATQFDRMTQVIRNEMHGGCFYQFDGEPALYRSVGACIPTRYAFSTHLNTWTEAPAIGVDPGQEVARIMLTHPDVVLIGEWTQIYLPNHISRAVVKDFLARDYERYTGFVLGTHHFGLYRLKHH
ncbi:hypothetical protein Y88_0589 [Novosphingobium nitrogenifigens DSM 19370]|uniref:Uncharacterized protein n=1 Tax=Novosphingobium nitrogenifigens DSM 19370 TaxID=983920 RepID=F1ZA59_9SPHN|nr:hypothetical protein Y88_0589 [Novosphingobium nitrogenifigens DSM 19370]